MGVRAGTTAPALLRTHPVARFGDARARAVRRQVSARAERARVKAALRLRPTQPLAVRLATRCPAEFGLGRVLLVRYRAAAGLDARVGREFQPFGLIAFPARVTRGLAVRQARVRFTTMVRRYAGLVDRLRRSRCWCAGCPPRRRSPRRMARAHFCGGTRPRRSGRNGTPLPRRCKNHVAGDIAVGVDEISGFCRMNAP